jgi:hypothetical protein
MSNNFLTFFVDQFNTTTLAQLLELSAGATDRTITSPNTAYINIPLSKFAGVFEFKTDGLLASGTAVLNNANTLYRFAYDKPASFFDSNPIASDASFASFDACKMDKTLSITSNYVSLDDSIGLSYTKYIAQEVMGNKNNYLIFVDYLTAISNINTSAHNGIKAQMINIQSYNTYDLSGSTIIGIKKNEKISGTTDDKPNPTYRILEQFGTKLVDTEANTTDLTTVRFTNTLLTAASSNWTSLPLRVGDKIIFKLTLRPTTNQRVTLVPKTPLGADNTGVVDDMTTLIQINIISNPV